MRAALKRRVNSRDEAHTLPALARTQLQSAGRTLLGARELETLLAWSDREGIGWYQLVVEDDRGAPTFEVWLLTSGDDGVMFTPGAPDHLGLIVSQTCVVDVQAARNELVAELQRALDHFVPPTFAAWLNEPHVTTLRPAEDP